MNRLYERLEREHEETPKRVTDHRAVLESLSRVGDVNGTSADRIKRFCESKNITLAALTALDTRVHVDGSGGVELAWGYPGRLDGAYVVTALKYRPLGDKPRYARTPSVFIEPLVVGDRSSLDWFVAEGETDACRLYDLVGDVAAIMVMPAGARTFKREWATRIPRGATVHLALDNDEHGDAGAEKCAKIIGGRTVRVRPPDSFKDWCEWRGGRDEFITLVANARRVTDDAEWVTLDTVEMRSIRFIDRPILQADSFHLFVGRKGVGKGTLIADIAARVTRGQLGGKTQVVWIGSEDSAAIDVKPRLVAAGGEPARVAIVKKWIQLPDDIDTIRRITAEVGDVGLIVIDPVGNHITGKNSNSETDIRDAIGRLNALADEEEAMLLGVRHLSEKECSRSVIAAILGSSAWAQVPRAVVAVVRDDENPDVSHVQVVAGNRLPYGELGRMFRIEGVRLPQLDEEVTRAVWIGESVKDVESLLTNSKPSRSGTARDLILDILEREGDQESDTLDARVAQETGLAAKTIRNLRSELRKDGLIKSIPEKDADGEVTTWRVVRTAAPRETQLGTGSHTGIGDHQIPRDKRGQPGNGLVTPDPLQIPKHHVSGPGEPDPGIPARDPGGDLDGRTPPPEEGIPW